MGQIFIVSTTQRCGSTWLTNTLDSVAKTDLRRQGISAEVNQSRAKYLNAIDLGFRLNKHTPASAYERLAEMIVQQTAGRNRSSPLIFKTHDIPSKDFDKVCSTFNDFRLLTLSRDFKDVFVSRYFYYRYYWKTQNGALPSYIAAEFKTLDDGDDEKALSILLGGTVIETWAREWAAFETEFRTERALRLHYGDLITGTGFDKLSSFIGYRIAKRVSIGDFQKRETDSTGRRGRWRFFRRGISGEWKEWFDLEAGAHLDRIAEKALICQKKLFEEAASEMCSGIENDAG